MTHLLRLLVATFSLAAALTFGALALGQARTLPPLVIHDFGAQQRRILDTGMGTTVPVPMPSSVPMRDRLLPPDEPTVEQGYIYGGVVVMLDGRMVLSARTDNFGASPSARWSADGSHLGIIVYTDHISADLYLLHATDDEATHVNEVWHNATAIEWSAEGHWLAFVDDNPMGGPNFLKVTRDGEAEVVAFWQAERAKGYLWSPTGARLAYIDEQTQRATVYHPHTGAYNRLPYRNTLWIYWTADSRLMVVHARDDATGMSIVLSDWTGQAQPQVIATGLPRVVYLSAMREGHMFAYVANAYDAADNEEGYVVGVFNPATGEGAYRRHDDAVGVTGVGLP